MPKVVIQSSENGPNLVKVDDNVVTVLCRCGASNNKPYCDGTHTKIKFNAKAEKVEVST